ncbi:hypothetical protein ACTFOZ_16265 [Bacillus cereus group sp. MYBK71-2]|uniref:hypothetical protein n=1 Tax=Bacillus cereus group sp. MYBK71-2 TaxID=3450611 RepID=UPI003F799C73
MDRAKRMRKEIAECIVEKYYSEAIPYISMLGAMENLENISFFKSIEVQGKKLMEQIQVAILQSSSGIKDVIREYHNPDTLYSIEALRQAIHCSINQKEAIECIIADLFLNGRGLEHALTAIMYDKSVSKVVKGDVLIEERLVEIIMKDVYSNQIKGLAIEALGRVLSVNKYKKLLLDIKNSYCNRKDFKFKILLQGIYVKNKIKNILREIE